MPYLTLNTDKSIKDITEVKEHGVGIQVSDAEVMAVANHPRGHIDFDYVNGKIVFSTQRADARELVKAKKEAIAEAIATDVEEQARLRIGSKLDALASAQNIAALKSLRNLP